MPCYDGPTAIEYVADENIKRQRAEQIAVCILRALEQHPKARAQDVLDKAVWDAFGLTKGKVLIWFRKREAELSKKKAAALLNAKIKRQRERALKKLSAEEKSILGLK